jgi:hypothetical protein
MTRRRKKEEEAWERSAGGNGREEEMEGRRRKKKKFNVLECRIILWVFFFYMMWQIVIGGVKGDFYAPSEGKLFPFLRNFLSPRSATAVRPLQKTPFSAFNSNISRYKINMVSRNNPNINSKFPPFPQTVNFPLSPKFHHTRKKKPEPSNRDFRLPK